MLVKQKKNMETIRKFAPNKHEEREGHEAHKVAARLKVSMVAVIKESGFQWFRKRLNIQ